MPYTIYSMRLETFWKLSLYFLFIFFVLHFLKDITQDILHIATPLDSLGNINEDLSVLSPGMQTIFTGLAYFSYALEVILIVSISKALRTKKITQYDKIALGGTFMMGIIFILFALTDPHLFQALK